MAKNLIPEICKMLGVELGEKFKIKGDVDTYEFGVEGLWGDYGIDAETLEALVCGGVEIIKLRWEPKEGEEYYTFIYDCYHKWCVWQQRWSNHPFDLALLEKGWVYRTREEAEAALPKVAARVGVEYKL